MEWFLVEDEAVAAVGGLGEVTIAERYVAAPGGGDGT